MCFCLIISFMRAVYFVFSLFIYHVAKQRIELNYYILVYGLYKDALNIS
jgi:hypothetical protein